MLPRDRAQQSLPIVPRSVDHQRRWCRPTSQCGQTLPCQQRDPWWHSAAPPCPQSSTAQIAWFFPSGAATCQTTVVDGAPERSRVQTALIRPQWPGLRQQQVRWQVDGGESRAMIVPKVRAAEQLRAIHQGIDGGHPRALPPTRSDLLDARRLHGEQWRPGHRQPLRPVRPVSFHARRLQQRRRPHEWPTCRQATRSVA